MSQPLIFFRPDNRFQSPFAANNFMQNQYPQSNDFNGATHQHPRTLHEPIKPRRSRRKRKLEETDIESINDNIHNNQQSESDNHSSYLTFIKPSNKRRRTNQMNASNNNNNSVILQPELEANIYTNQLIKNHKNNNYNNDNDNDRSHAPYSHLIHPYLRNKNKNKNKNKQEQEQEHVCESPLNLNGFKMKNKENQSVNDWKRSIQSQLNKARSQLSDVNIEQLCTRINNTSGLGRDVLMAKLRKELPNNIFLQICHIMRINPDLR